ncbi:hypothetical protein KAJ89_00160, partial [Candidatus Parcubacteria bacterium]|nr:hypothetical protein [Candidatus Parcubacteria bacterium]
IIDFNEIDQAINIYYAENKKLPENLSTLQETISFLRDDDLRDPATNKAYEYKVSGDKSYELCATFRTVSADEKSREYYFDDRWQYEAGEQCLKQTVHVEGKDFPIEARPVLVD